MVAQKLITRKGQKKASRAKEVEISGSVGLKAS